MVYDDDEIHFHFRLGLDHGNPQWNRQTWSSQKPSNKEFDMILVNIEIHNFLMTIATLSNALRMTSVCCSKISVDIPHLAISSFTWIKVGLVSLYVCVFVFIVYVCASFKLSLCFF